MRKVTLPKGTAGKLYLHSMPGRDGENMTRLIAEMQKNGITVVVSLVEKHEIEKKSPAYAEALRNGQFPFRIESFPISDYGLPEDDEAFAAFAGKISGMITEGTNVLIHCAAGIGRTGMCAVTVLLALGMDLRTARDTIVAAGSMPESGQPEYLERTTRHFPAKE
ncbi:MAG: tyrosine-protein phosphatase [Spirochaetota bacterium]